MTKREIIKALKIIVKNMEKADENQIPTDMELDDNQDLYFAYLGETYSIDPCGKHHCILSPNGITKRCERFWGNLYDQVEKLNCWVKSSEGDYCSLFIYQIRNK